MRVTTIRVRPLRRSTIEEQGIDAQNVTGLGAEFWVGGQLVAVLNYEPDLGQAEIIWGTALANDCEPAILLAARGAASLMIARAEREEAAA